MKTKTLPPGQKESAIFPRFGLPQYANRFPKEIDNIKFTIGGDLDEFEISTELKKLSRINQVSDFHCVTTWSKLDLNWSGYLFRDFYDTLILPKVAKEIKYVVIKAQDGYSTSLLLEDLMKPNVLIADQLDNQPLNIEHGAPVRIVAPDHYGYKNVKHINLLLFYEEKPKLKGMMRFIDHPRARVAYEERGNKGPGSVLRYLYRFGIQSTIKDFEKALEDYRKNERI